MSVEEIISGLQIIRDSTFEDSYTHELAVSAISVLREMIEWIRVEDDLPKDGEAVLVYYSGKEAVPPQVNTSCLYDMGFLLEDLYGQVTHWMPFPDPPDKMNCPEGAREGCLEKGD